MKRPPGIVALCVLLLWSFAVDLHRWWLMHGGLWRRGSLHRPAVGLLLLVPAAAAVAMVGLWRLRPWAPAAFAIWAAFAGLQTGMILVIVGGMGKVGAPGFLVLGVVWLLSLAILAGLWAYVRGAVRTADPG